MKKNLLDIVKNILSDLDSDDVNSISDTVEALQVANIVEQTFYDIISTRNIPEHQSLIKLTPLSDNQFPTHFVLEDTQHKIKEIWYDTSDDNSYEYTLLVYLSPEEFLRKCDYRQSNYTLVSDKVAGTKLRIGNLASPKFYTSFDDEHVVMDSFNSLVDSTLRKSKVRAIGTSYPTFSISDYYTPDIDASYFPYLIQEAKSRAFSLFKGQPDSKTEQAARRQKVYVQNDRYRLQAPSKKRNYGRR